MAALEKTGQGGVRSGTESDVAVPSDAVRAAPTDENEDGAASWVVIFASLLVSSSLVMSCYALSVALDRNGVLIASSLGQTNLALQLAVPGAPIPGEPEPPVFAEKRDPSTLDLAGSPTKGPEDAKVTLIQFCDLQSPQCVRVMPTLRKLRESYGDDLRIVFKHLLLKTHPKAPAAHRAAEAAHRQGRFWELHNKMLLQQALMTEEKYLEWAAEIGMDMARFERDLASQELSQKIEADMREARELGLLVSPYFFVNGQRLEGAKSFAEFKALIDRELGR